MGPLDCANVDVSTPLGAVGKWHRSRLVGIVIAWSSIVHRHRMGIKKGVKVQFASASVDITPRGPVLLAGQTSERQSVGVAEPLELNVLAFRNCEGDNPVVILTFDLLYVGRILRRMVEEQFSEIPPCNIMVVASHTHRAPMTDDTKPCLGLLDQKYLSMLKELLSQVHLGGEGSPWRPGELWAGRHAADGGINRRLRKTIVISSRPRFRAFVNAPNPAGFKDETLSVLVGRTIDQKLAFVIWNYACHPVGYPTKDQVAAHFPGRVRTMLREHFEDPGLPVGYLQGFSGNIRPAASARINGFLRRVRRAITGPIFSDMSLANYMNWSTSLGTGALEAVERADRLKSQQVDARREQLPTAHFVSDADEPAVTFQSIRFSPDLCVVGISAEVVAEYVPIVRRIAGSEVMCVGCIDHVFGYAPTLRIYDEGGYEGGGFCRAFGLGRLNPLLQNSMIEGIESVLK